MAQGHPANVPIFVDYISNFGGSQKTGANSIYNFDNDTGSALICGMRPSRITNIHCDKNGTKCNNKYILDCSVEGGLGEDQE